MKYQIFDYILFCFFWVLATSNVLLFYLISDSNRLIHFQLLETSIVLFNMIVFSFGIRQHNFSSNLTKAIWSSIAYITPLLLFFCILFWELTNADLASSIYRPLPRDPDYPMMVGALIIKDKIYYSNSHNLPRQVYGLLSYIFLAYVQLKTKVLVDQRRVLLASRLWKTVAVCGLFFSFFQWRWLFIDTVPKIAVIFAFLLISLVTAVTLLFVEGFVLTISQLGRIEHLFEKMENENLSEKSESPMSSDLRSYLEDLKDLMDHK